MFNRIYKYIINVVFNLGISNSKKNKILFVLIPKRKRRKKPNHLKNYFVTTTTSITDYGADYLEFQTNSYTQIKEKWKMKYFDIMDTLIVNLGKQFSAESLKITITIDNLF